MEFWIVFASSGGFIVYSYVVAFYTVFVNDLAFAGCVVSSDGFPSA